MMGNPPFAGKNSRSFGGRKFNRPSLSKRAVNLGKLAKALDPDVLSAVLGISQGNLQDLVDGKSNIEESQYLPHITSRLNELGFPKFWLDKQDPQIPPDVLKSLRKEAAQSESKAPTRRQNFKALAFAFEERLDELALALEITVDSIRGISEGRLEFNDQRYGHINPRLLAAGFADDWLSAPDAVVSEKEMTGIAELAKEVQEQTHREAEEERRDEEARRVRLANERAEKAAREAEELANAQKMSAAAEPAHDEHPVAEQAALTGQPDVSDLSGTAQQLELLQKEPEMKKKTGATLGRAVRGAGRGLGASLPKVAMKRGPKVGSKRAAPVASVEPKKTVPAKKVAASVATGAAPAKNAKGAGDPSKIITEKRAKALERLLKDARRGAKVCLWRDLLNSSLPYWHNIKKNIVAFKDETAREVENALGLPENWLDKPSFPPETLAPWVMDASIPLPVTKARQPKKRSSPPVTSTQSLLGASNPSVSAPVREARPDVAITESSAKAPATAPRRTAGTTGYAWAPSPAQATGEVGNMVVSLTNVIQKFAKDGLFTEDDAYEMMEYLMSQKRNG